MSNVSRYLALDLGTRTGWCVADGAKIIGSGIRDFSVKNSEQSGLRGIRFYNWLMSFGRVDEIYYEKIMFTGARKGGGAWGGDHGELYHGLLMLLNMYAAGYGTPIIGIWPGTLKKSFTGYGKAEKHDMCLAAREHGWTGGKDGTAAFHDEADAIALIVTQLRERFNIHARF